MGESALTPLTRVIDQYSSVLASPDLVAPDLGIAAGSVSENIPNYTVTVTHTLASPVSTASNVPPT